MDEEKKEIKEIVQEPAKTEEVKQTKYELVVCNKKGNEKRYALENGKEIIVGAMPECDIYVDDEYLSGKHFSIKLSEGKIEVKDIGSKNGLYLMLENAVQVNAGSGLLAGKTIFKVEECNA